MASCSKNLRWLEKLYPGYFAATMATGIIAIGMDLLGEMKVLCDVFSVIAIASWLTLVVIFSLRIYLFPKAVLADIKNPQLTFNFFTFVAGTSVMGLVLELHDLETLAFICWGIAFLAWAILLYISFSVLTLLHGDRNVRVVDGGWLIGIVGTESLVLLGLKDIHHLGEYAAPVMLVIFMLWGLGLALYAIFVTLFCHRIFFLEMKNEDYTPQMWVIMGASAICANASSTLDMAPPLITVLYEVHPFIDSMALLTWAWATWWIPLLVIIGYWKHVVHKLPLGYDPRQWSIVFPIGMYTVASVQLSLAAEFDQLHAISHVMIWIAIGMWCLLAYSVIKRAAGWLFVKRPVVVE